MCQNPLHQEYPTPEKRPNLHWKTVHTRTQTDTHRYTQTHNQCPVCSPLPPSNGLVHHFSLRVPFCIAASLLLTITFRALLTKKKTLLSILCLPYLSFFHPRASWKRGPHWTPLLYHLLLTLCPPPQSLCWKHFPQKLPKNSFLITKNNFLLNPY